MTSASGGAPGATASPRASRLSAAVSPRQCVNEKPPVSISPARMAWNMNASSASAEYASATGEETEVGMSGGIIGGRSRARQSRAPVSVDVGIRRRFDGGSAASAIDRQRRFEGSSGTPLRARSPALLLAVTTILLAPMVMARARQARIEDVEQS